MIHLKYIMDSELQYQVGFGNHFASEAEEGALPKGQNSPQECPFGLYAEQLSGTPFTYPRAKMQRSWLYRIRPSVTHEPYQAIEEAFPFYVSEFGGDEGLTITPNQLRWKP